VVRTPFGKLKLDSPQRYRCLCEAQRAKSVSPLAELLHERTSPELAYLETKFAGFCCGCLPGPWSGKRMASASNTAGKAASSQSLAIQIGFMFGEFRKADPQRFQRGVIDLTAHRWLADGLGDQRIALCASGPLTPSRGP
jgi:hypothetical protein